MRTLWHANRWSITADPRQNRLRRGHVLVSITAALVTFAATALALSGTSASAQDDQLEYGVPGYDVKPRTATERLDDAPSAAASGPAVLAPALTIAPAPTRLRIMSWHLADAVKAGVISRAKPQIKTWRHTFGSERHSAAAASTDAMAMDADIVLLQGVRTWSELRLLLPADTWRVIASRQLIQNARNASVRQPIVPTTAVAVRYQREVRVTAVRQLLGTVAAAPARASALIGLEAPAASGPAPTRPLAPPTPPDPASVAIRVWANGATLWLVSASMTPDCQRDAAVCGSARALAQWTKRTNRTQAPILFGGQIISTEDNQPSQPGCDHQRLQMINVETAARVAFDTKLTCALKTTLKVQPPAL